MQKVGKNLFTKTNTELAEHRIKNVNFDNE